MTRCLLLLIGLGPFAVFGCAPQNMPDSLILYSINGTDKVEGVERPMGTGEEFRGYPVLGKIDVSDPAKRLEIIAAVEQGIADSDGTMAKCFWPRHGIRLVRNGETADYVICFECLQLHIYRGEADDYVAITKSPQETLDAHLKDAGVPLARRLRLD